MGSGRVYDVGFDKDVNDGCVGDNVSGFQDSLADGSVRSSHPSRCVEDLLSHCHPLLPDYPKSALNHRLTEMPSG